MIGDFATEGILSILLAVFLTKQPKVEVNLYVDFCFYEYRFHYDFLVHTLWINHLETELKCGLTD